ncbi:tRNA(Ile)-lysidine synthase [Neisseria sp. HSC-16F19]|nr:tRNA lysidine(34) synthetase TilS [Neisseria sp. HSC-16F19]MCP2041613.1 tRNA(Ile)-lysidine synthase [Neisseria sp. HSC-16F19]
MANSAANKHAELASALQQQWPAALAGHCVIEVGLSGGLDSVVLLHLLNTLRAKMGFELQAVHVHHGLQAAADAWPPFCADLCQRWQIPLRCEYVQPDMGQGLGIEATARQARYAVFARSTAHAVALAHHADDQCETFLLAALRGGGGRALSAMPALRTLTADTLLWRPLLSFPRATLAAYAAAHQLPHIEDPSNEDPRHLRNWLRGQWLPALAERLPDYRRHIQAAVTLLQQEQSALAELDREDSRRLYPQGLAEGMDVAQWRKLGPARQQRQLYAFARQHGLGTPTHHGVAAFARMLRQDRVTRGEWPLPQGKAVWHQGRLWPQHIRAQQQWPWLDNTDTADWLLWQPHRFGLPAVPEQAVWRCVQRDDVLQRANGRKNIRQLLQERGIVPFMRRIWPVLTDTDGRCLAVANIAVDSELGVADGWMPYCDRLPIRVG